MSEVKPNSGKTVDARIRAASPGDEIVITGVSGKFPNAENVAEFAKKLYNKVDLVTALGERWPNYDPEIPSRMGIINDIEKFDATFFGVPYKQTHCMDPQGRLLIETAYEAILDAGVCPKSIRGSKTGVFIGACFNESERAFFYDPTHITLGGLGISGCSRAMLANRVSYCLGLTGPSFMMDTACSSSMYALDVAFSAIRSGECDAALVGGSNLLLHPYTTLQFARLGVIAKDGYCRPFDEKASGYTRSEGICVIYLQRARDAKRIYANLIYSKANCDGYKIEGITYPSGEMQEALLAEFYDDLQLDPTTVGYVEAHSTGTFVGDPEECKALDNIFCRGRTEPLLVGSIKSNIGHTESTSGACSITKAIIAFEHGKVPPNLNFEQIRSSIPALTEKRMIVCSETTPLNGDKIAINSFGFGGANAHALLSMNPKNKINGGAPLDNIPRLVNWAGRTEEAVNAMLNTLESQPLDAEYIGLLHSAQAEEVQGYLHRGYTILSKDSNGDISKNALSLSRAMKRVDGNKLPVVWLFSGMGSQWPMMGKALMVFPQFRETVQLCHRVLKPFGVDLMSVITSDDPKTFDHIVNSFIGISCIQIGLVNILRLLDVKMDYCIGHSVGELGVAYADGTLTAEQTILAAYSRGVVSVETKVIEGSMAAVGLGYEKVVHMLPPTIEAACRNSGISTTISGPKADVAKFVEELKSQGIFAKEVQCSNIPYHSRYIADMGPKLLHKLREIIPQPLKRSGKWLSTSVPKEEWHLQQSNFSSAEYHTNNLLKPVLFEETVHLLPSESIVIEIAPHGLLQAIVKKSMLQAVHVPLTHRGHENNAVFFLSALGKMFLNGLTLPIERLYPKVEFPVSRGTPMISPLIKWDHTEDWFVMKFFVQKGGHSGERKVSVSLDVDPYISGHIIDGRVIVPGTTYLQLVWDTLSMMTFGAISTTINVEFEDVRFLRATTIAPGQKVDLNIMIHYGSGHFEITENGVTVVSGMVRNVETTESEDVSIDAEEFENGTNVLDKKDFYKELRLRGYHYQNLFQGVEKTRLDGQKAIIKWNDNWAAFLDTMLQVNILAKDSRALYLPTRIRRVRIDSVKQTATLNSIAEQNGELMASYDPEMKMVKCGGVEIYDMSVNAIARRKPPGLEVLEAYRFLPLVPSETLTLLNGVHVLTQLIIENTVASPKLRIVEIDSKNVTPIITLFDEAISRTPLIIGDLQFLTEQDVSLENVKTLKGTPVSDLKGYNVMIAMEDATIEMEQVLKSIEEKSFLLVRKSGNATFTELPTDFNMITTIPTESETLVLLQRKQTTESLKDEVIIEVLSNDFNYQWLEGVKNSIKSGPVLLVAQNDPTPGLLGLVNCLRREPGGEKVRCVIIMDRLSPKFAFENSLYVSQLDLGLAINVYRNSVWGTYRFFELKPNLQETPRLDHVYANVQRIGDLSSFDWLNGPLKPTVDKLVNVHYSSINFKDVMLATGRLSTESCHGSRIDGDCLLGFEFSGINTCGERVMGMVKSGSMATQVKPIEHFTWIIPKDWSLRDGATIPTVYITVYYAFFFGKPITRGKSILIHAGSGGIGLAAIRIALAYGLEVFTTVSTQQKKKFILSLFPQLKEENIGKSRDCSFEHLVLRRTKGRGVDFVLNSLSDEKLLASVRCLAPGGTFLEIGKFDIMNNSALGMSAFENETTFRAVFADNLIYMPEERKIVYELMDKDLRTGIIQPLHSTAFHVNEIEHAYRFMSTGKHVGKVMIQIRETEHSLASVPIKVNPKVYCKPDLVYIVTGGLGGFGVELCDWLVVRGARFLVLNSRRGVTTSYQAFRIRLWESYGCKVIVNIADIGTYQGTKSLLVQSLTYGQIGGIFNLAVVLRDSILENQSVEKFQESIAPKAIATRYFNELSRILCPKLEHFVVFSSASCGRGNAGQSNYGMANSIMERIIEQRLQEKLPGKAIQWGAIGEVGLVAEMLQGKDIEVVGTMQQRIESCLNVLDTLLTSPQAIVSSIVVADKHAGEAGQDGQMTLIKSVMKIMGIRDIKSISKNASLAELGMDSLMSVEIKQVLEREFDVFLTPQQLRSVTFAKLEELSSSGAKHEAKASNEPQIPANILFQNLGDESMSDITLLPINNLAAKSPQIIFIPGIEGVGGPIWQSVGANMKIPSKLLQLMKSRNEIKLKAIADTIIDEVYGQFTNQNEYYIVGHSFGTYIAMKIASMLEKRGKVGHVILIDGSPTHLFRLAQGLRRTVQTGDPENDLIMVLFAHFCSTDMLDSFAKKLATCNSLLAKIELICEFVSSEFKTNYSKQYLYNITGAILNRLKLVMNLNFEKDEFAGVIDAKLKSSITLVRPTLASFTDIVEDYDLHKYTEQRVNVKYVDGNHLTVLENTELTNILNEITTQPTKES
ncbi:fatty acid synthase-like [Sitodiplosis mosellana]|uniref:fatty acid synthase-like n=1 Tax=Sitodiplosis mosellana TaxID=263140 RepID=UPI00244529D2|nr:fatty acid synthase-like [Sitodiplosis mosellana]